MLEQANYRHRHKAVKTVKIYGRIKCCVYELHILELVRDQFIAFICLTKCKWHSKAYRIRSGK